ncbi:helix-turn-helix transcriptional regulator [Actinomadura kijaniata]|uniref:helix-turn-helix transcriptional regulator n=1 Tax=Actinomadura kijaniata TaxID=46161 RepID=UPI003F1C99A4
MSLTADAGPAPRSTAFHGRERELARLGGLLADARRGRSGALVVRGEAGIGKSALLERVAALARDDVRVLRGAGVEPEMELPFAGLHLLLHGALNGVDALPGPQAAALRGALGLAPSPEGGDRFLVGLAVLTLLADLADDRPLLCLVDDAHWLDHASAEALLFAARRLEAEGVVLVFAARDEGPAFPAPGVPELRLPGLDDASAAALLAEHAADLAAPARDRVVAEARGNPLALLELPGTLCREQRRGELPVHSVGFGGASARVGRIFAARIAALPPATRTLLLVAAADDTGRLETVLAAPRRLDAGFADADPAEAAGLVRPAEGRLEFRHPLVRTAVYEHAPAGRRAAAHRALAGAFADLGDDVRRAWHLASAATGPDEEAAGALERCTEHARRRGGYAAVASAYERAALLSPDRGDRGRRLLAAARAAADAGRHAWADRLAGQAADDLDDAADLARAARVRAVAAAARGRPETAHSLLVSAAGSLAGRDRDTAAVMYFEAITYAWNATNLPALLDGARRAGGPPDDADPLVLAAASLARLEEGALPRTRWVRDMVEGLRAHGRPPGLRERAQMAIWDWMVGDDDAAHRRAVAIERDCRDEGAVGVLPTALGLLALSQLFLGRYRDARASAEEALRVAEDTLQHDQAALLTGLLACLAGLFGEEERCRSLCDRLPAGHAVRTVSLNMLDLSLGRHEAVVRRAERHGAAAGTPLLMTLHRPHDLVEAAVRADRPDLARTMAAWVREWADHTGQPWQRGVALRCRALLADDRDADALYAEAVALHGRGGRPFERARTELLYGEWLRRSRRRVDARPPLRSAVEIFDRLGARVWADRARSELRATGERRVTPGHAPGVLDRLTPQEAQIVRLAASGMSNRQIAARLFLSPRTVGHHLYKAFPKLGVASRGELSRLDIPPLP